jgi:hypothetical protein
MWHQVLTGHGSRPHDGAWGPLRRGASAQPAGSLTPAARATHANTSRETRTRARLIALLIELIVGHELLPETAESPWPSAVELADTGERSVAPT